MPTVQKLARELGLTSQEVMTRLKALGRPAEGHLSDVEDQVAERLRRETTGSILAGEISGDNRMGRDRGSADQARDDGTPDGEKPDGEKPDGEQPDGEKPDGEQPDSKKPDSKKPDSKRKPAPPKPKSARNKWLKRAAEVPLLILVAFLVAVVIKMFLVQAFFIPSGSMRPTLRGGDRVLVEKLSYLFGSPNQGDVIVFARPDAAEKPKNQAWYDDAQNFMRDLLGLPTPGTTDYIKRVAAVGGDTIRYDGNPRVLAVNGKRIKEPYLQGPDDASAAITGDSCSDMKLESVGDGCRVPAGTVFVLGDNRTKSQDSRFLGPIKEEKIIGRAFVVIWPVDDFSGL